MPQVFISLFPFLLWESVVSRKITEDIHGGHHSHVGKGDSVTDKQIRNQRVNYESDIDRCGVMGWLCHVTLLVTGTLLPPVVSIRLSWNPQIQSLSHKKGNHTWAQDPQTAGPITRLLLPAMLIPNHLCQRRTWLLFDFVSAYTPFSQNLLRSWVRGEKGRNIVALHTRPQ